MAILIRRTLIITRAPIFKSFKRMVPQVALANCVRQSRSPTRKRLQQDTELSRS